MALRRLGKALFRSPCRFSIAIESLEARQLLAADFLTANVANDYVAKDYVAKDYVANDDVANDYVATPIHDVFSRDAVTVEQMIARTKAHPYLPGELIVAVESSGHSKIHATPSDTNWSALLNADASPRRTMLELERNGRSLALVHLDIDADVIDAMRQIDGADGVLWAAPNFYSNEDPRELIPNDPLFPDQYQHTLMQSAQAWDTTLGSSVVIAVTDDGVDLNHADLNDNIWLNVGEIAGNGVDDDGNGYIDDVNGYDFANDNPDPGPNSLSDNHGTHVAGVAAAETDNAIGIAGTAGDAVIMPLQIHSPGSGNNWSSTTLSSALIYAADNGAKIVVTSFNVNGLVGDPTYIAGLQYMYDQGLLHFNSGGNGNDLNPPRTQIEQSLFVANTDANDKKAFNSNWGNGIDISAPGVEIIAPKPGGGYNTFSGTSQSAPNAAGTAALIWAANPTWTREMVAAQLLATADNIDGLNPAYAGLLGTGRVNSNAALNTVLGAPQVKSLAGLPADGTSVTATSIIDEIRLQFTQLMEPSTINDTANYELRSAGSDGAFDTTDDLLLNLALDGVYQVGTNEFDIEILDSLGIGDYRFTLSGTTNPFGTGLDGNGDGTGGDSYEHYFSIGLESFKNIGVLGTLGMASTGNAATIVGLGDSNEFEFFAEAGEIVSAVVTPNTSSPTLTVEIPGVIAPETATAGAPVVLPLGVATTTGPQSIRITADMASDYQFSIFRNVNIQALDEGADPVAIDDSYMPDFRRLAAFAQSNGSEGGIQFDHYSNSSLFVDISTTGTALNLEDDGEGQVTTTVGNSVFPAGPTTISNNGAIVSGTFNVDWNNAELPALGYERGLFPFWDDIDSESGNVYWEERQVGGINTLIVQWDDRPHHQNVGGATFQIQVFESGPLPVRFVYDDVDFDEPEYDYGASATIGFQLNRFNADQFSYNEPILANGDVIDIYDTVPTVDTDIFSVDLTPFVGHHVDIVVASTGDPLAGATLELFDPNGVSVAAGSNTPLGSSVENYQLGLLEYSISTGGVYEIAISSNSNERYVLSVTEGMAFDTESNDAATDALRSLDEYDGAIGGIEGAEDFYEIKLNAGMTVEFETETPLDAPGRFPLNDLDPSITVSDMAGTVLGSDDNSSADGKNAMLSFTAPATGTYVVAIGGPGTGEYILQVNTIVDGDFNDDGVWNCADIDALVAAIAGGSTSPEFDLTGDGAVDLADRDAWLAEAGEINLGSGLSYRIGDANLDEVVDGLDFIEWNNNRFTNVAAWCSGDFDANGIVDGLDFILWNDNRFQSSMIVDNEVETESHHGGAPIAAPVFAAPAPARESATEVSTPAMTFQVNETNSTPKRIRFRATDFLFAVREGELKNRW